MNILKILTTEKDFPGVGYMIYTPLITIQIILKTKFRRVSR